MANFNAIRYNVPYSGAGNLKLITTSTASSSATISFTSGIDSTYKEYLFIFNSMHPATDQLAFHFKETLLELVDIMKPLLLLTSLLTIMKQEIVQL